MHGDANVGMDKVRPDSERPATVLKGKAAGIERERMQLSSATAEWRTVTGMTLLLEAGMIAAVGRAGESREFGIRDEEFSGVGMLDSLGNVGFRRQAGKAVGDV